MTSIIDALKLRIGFEPVDQNDEEEQLRLLGRVPNSKVPALLQLVVILHQNAGRGWDLDISKSYFPRGNLPVYAWRFIFEGTEDGWKDKVAAAIMQPVHVETGEIRIHGKRDLNPQNNRGKGATATKA